MASVLKGAYIEYKITTMLSPYKVTCYIFLKGTWFIDNVTVNNAYSHNTVRYYIYSEKCVSCNGVGDIQMPILYMYINYTEY